METRRKSKSLKMDNNAPDSAYNLRDGLRGRKGVCGNWAKCSTMKQEGKNNQLSFNLPSEIMLIILNYLPLKAIAAASAVCKAWRELCKEQSLWKTVSFEGSNVNKLSLTLWKKLDKLGTTCLDFHSYLTFPHEERSIYFKASVLASITKLKKVTTLYFGALEKGDLNTIVQNMPQLKILHVTCLLPSNSYCNCFYYDMGSLCILKSLEELKLSSLYSVTVPTFAFSGGMNSLEALHNLKKLVIVENLHQFLYNLEDIPDDSIQFLKKLPHLEHLELGNCLNFHIFAFRALMNLENLKTLSLTHAHCRCSQYGCVCMAPCLASLKSLTKLSLLMCTIPEVLNEALVDMKCLASLEIWPYLNRYHPKMWSRDKYLISDSFVELFQGMDHLQSATIGVLDENIHDNFMDPFCPTSEGSTYGSDGDCLWSSSSSDYDSFGISSDEDSDDNDEDSDDSDDDESSSSCSEVADDVKNINTMPTQSHDKNEDDSTGEKNVDAATSSQSTENAEDKMGAERVEKGPVKMTEGKITAEKDMVSEGEVGNLERVMESREAVCNAGGEARCEEGEEVQKADSVGDGHRLGKSVVTGASKTDELCDKGVIDKKPSQLVEHMKSKSVVGAVCQANSTLPKNDESAAASSHPVAAKENQQESPEGENSFKQSGPGLIFIDTSKYKHGEEEWTELFELVKQKFFEILPKTRLTLYRVSESRSDSDKETDMFYISRIEERYTKLDI